MKDAEYGLSLYWTRLQVGVKDKTSKKQVWCTPSSLETTFMNKVLLGNAIAPRFLKIVFCGKT